MLLLLVQMFSLGVYATGGCYHSLRLAKKSYRLARLARLRYLRGGGLNLVALVVFLAFSVT